MKKNLIVIPVLFVFFGPLTAQFSFSNRSNLLSDQTVRSGAPIGIADMNGDGLDDIIRLDNTSVLKLEYQNSPNTVFSGFNYGLVTGSQWSLCIADVDGNGFNDIFTGGSYNGLKLLKANATGTGYNLTTFTEPSIFLQGANFADIDADGHADLFACHDDGISVAFRNSGIGSFLPDTSLIYPESTVPSDNSGNYGSVWTDYDSDGDLDLYISKCRLGVGNPLDGRRLNLLFQNDGDNHFTDVAEASGLRPLGQSWATDFADIDNDGDLDAFIINHDISSRLYLNNDFGAFTDITAQSGMAAALSTAGPGIQVKFADFDNDGWVDLLFTSTGSNHCLFRNNGDNTFTNFPTAFPTGIRIHSAAVGDLNNDGFLDIIAGFATSYNDPSSTTDRLFMNNGNGNNYCKVRLEGNLSNPNGIGARLEIYGLWGLQVREVRSGESYGIMNSLTQHFGLADYPYIDSLLVRWPSGVIDKLAGPAINTTLVVEEGQFCQPDVQFSYEVSEATVTFEDESSIGANEWLWTFGDGNSSTEENPVHEYAQDGVYEVCLEAGGLCGTGQNCQLINVNCNTPQSVFGYETDGLIVSFTDQSLNNPVEWFWTFGDATSSGEQNPVHTFPSPGTYFVCLDAIGPCGQTQSCEFITLGCPQTEAAFSAVTSDLSAQFSDNSTGGFTEWMWDFGDGNTSGLQNPEHTYDTVGVYTVCLDVTGPCGGATACEEVTVSCPSPTAVFSYQQSGLSLAFLNESSDNIQTSFWTFGDGGSSPQTNPTHTFEQAGTYEVCLEVSSPCGTSQNCETLTVECLIPQAAFSFTEDELLLSFSDNSSDMPTSWSWIFGDGSSSTLQNPQHTYESPGLYEVCLEVSGVCGSSQSCMEVEVGCTTPEAAFTYQSDELQLSFSDNSANNPSSWSWNFGDGQTSGEQNPVHTYTQPGNYEVCLEVSGICGASQECLTLEVSCAAPQADFSYQIDGPDVNFTDQSTQGPVSWTWLFGDGTTASGPNPQYTYPEAGTYEVCLTVASICGNTQTCQTLTISCADPVAGFTFQADELQLTFSDNSINSPTSWLWTFGDGGTSAGANPQYEYAAPGEYEVCLQITNDCGADTFCQMINVSCLAPQAAFTLEADELTVSLNDASANDPTSWLWDFGDGNMSTDQNPVHQYTTPGNYEICLTATSVCGSAQSCQTLTVNCQAPQADFNFSANQLILNCQDESSNEPTSWLWTFGDGSSSTEQNPQHTYSLPGTYAVCLQVSSVCGSTQRCEQISVTCVSPIASIGYQQDELSVLFLDNSANNPTQWLWTFGDGASSAEANPQHIYEAPGVYQVCLTVTSPCGSSQTCLSVLVSCQAPEASFSVSNTGDLTLLFLDASTNNPTSWLWDFGDGSTSTEQNPVHTYSSGNNFTVCLTASSICGSDMICQNILLTSTENDPAGAVSFQLFPNPSSGLLQVRLTGLARQKVTLSVYRATGQLIRNFEQIIEKEDMRWLLDLTLLPAGLYYLQLETEKNIMVKKVILE